MSRPKKKVNNKSDPEKVITTNTTTDGKINQSHNIEPPKRKTSKLAQLNQKPVIIFITWVLSIFGAIGGVAGVISFIDYLKRDPEFSFRVTSWLTGTSSKNNRTAILLFGSIFNDGQKPFYPDHFEVEITYDDEICIPQPFLYEGNANWSNDSAIIKLTDPEQKDFQKINVIQPGELVQGLLFFGTVIPKEKFINANNLSFKIICTDFQGKKHYSSSRRPTPDHPPSKGRQVMPKQGIDIQPKDSNSAGSFFK